MAEYETDALDVTGEPVPTPQVGAYYVPGAIVSLGEEFLRRGDKKLVAITRVSITLDSEEKVKDCIEAIQASDALLAAKPPELRPYDWQLVARVGNTISFGVAWYDREFFDKKKDAYKSAQHASIFGRLGVEPSKFSVQHFVADEG